MPDPQPQTDTSPPPDIAATFGITPASAPLPAPTTKVSLPTASTSGAVPQPSGPLNIPPEASQLIKVIEAHELTPGRSEWQLYGGQTFTPGAEHPKDMGWGGDRGPDGRPTSAAGPGQWERDTWRDEAKRIAALGVEPNFADMAQQRWAMWDLGSRTYKARTGRDLSADIQAGKADWQSLGSIWQGLQSGVSPHLVSGSYNAPAQGYVDQLMRQMQATQPGMQEAIGEAKDLHSMARAMASKWMSESDKPPQNMRQAWSEWGTVAGALALLGGLGHGHMNAALSAAGSMLQAANSADQHAYDMAYKQWSDHLSNGIKAIEMVNKEAMDIIADSKLGYDEMAARLNILSSAAGLQQKLDPQSPENLQRQLDRATALNGIVKLNNIDAAYRNEVSAWVADPANASKVVTDPATGQKAPPQDVQLQLRAKVEQEAKGTATEVATQIKQSVFTNLKSKYLGEGMSDAEATRRAGQESGFLPAGKAGTESEFIHDAIAAEEGRLKRPLTNDERTAVEAKAHADWGKASAVGKQEAGYDLSQKIYGDETIGMVADSYIAGNDHAMVGMARQNVGAYAMARVWQAIGDKLSIQETKEFQEVYGRAPDAAEKKVLDEDRGRRLAIARAEFQGIKSGERTAFTRAAGLVTAAAEAKQFTPQALETSAKVSRTDYPTLNAIEMAVKEHTGSKEVVDFYVATTSLADAYAQVIGRGNAAMTDGARAQAMGMLNRSWSEGQYETAVARINKEIDAAQKAPEEVVQRFREGFLQRQSAAPAAPVGAVQPGGHAPPQSPTSGVVIQNGWRYDAKTHQPLGPAQ